MEEGDRGGGVSLSESLEDFPRGGEFRPATTKATKTCIHTCIRGIIAVFAFGFAEAQLWLNTTNIYFFVFYLPENKRAWICTCADPFVLRILNFLLAALASPKSTTFHIWFLLLPFFS